MAIIIGDIHGDLAMARSYLEYKPEAEHVALGDYVDSRDPQATPEDELATLNLLIESKSILLWGNHDLAYLTHALWVIDHRFPAIRGELNSIYESAASQNRFVAAHSVGGWLCTHAGVSAALTDNLPAGPWDSGNPGAIASWINAEFEREIVMPKRGPLFARDWTRGGNERFGGIFWYDPNWEPSHIPDPQVKQIFGHTQTEGPMKKSNWVNIHIESGSGYWIYDTEIDDFVRLKN